MREGGRGKGELKTAHRTDPGVAFPHPTSPIPRPPSRVPLSNRMNVADAKGDFVVRDLRRSIVVDLGREALRDVVLRANQLGRTVDRALNEGEQTVDRLAEPPVDRLSCIEVEHAGDRVAQHDYKESVGVSAAMRERQVGSVSCPHSAIPASRVTDAIGARLD